MKALTYLNPITCLFLALVFFPKTVDADLVLNTFSDVTWDRTINPAASPRITFSTSIDDLIVNGNEINAFNVGLRFVPTSGAIGTITAFDRNVPVANPVFTAFDAITPGISDNPGIPTINGYNSESTDVLVTGTQNLFSIVAISESNDALGLFEVYAVPEFTSYFDLLEFDGFRFSNVPVSPGESFGPDVLLGRINVTATAVPEPMSLVLFCGASMGVGIRYRVGRNRRMKAPR
jgi:hypothetical protein